MKIEIILGRKATFLETAKSSFLIEMDKSTWTVVKDRYGYRRGFSDTVAALGGFLGDLQLEEEKKAKPNPVFD